MAPCFYSPLAEAWGPWISARHAHRESEGEYGASVPRKAMTRPGSIEARELLENPNFGATPQAADDLKRGVVDKRLAAALGMLTEKHRICVDTFKKIHFFLPGVLDGPRIPEGYCKAGGLPNTHHYGGAADVRLVDGKPLKGNATDPDVLEAGELLACLSPTRRPD